MALVHLVTHRPVGFRDVSRAIHSLGEEAFTGAEGSDLTVHLGGLELAKRVAVEVGEIEETAEPIICMVVPLRIRAVEDPASFPTFEGDLEVVAVSHDRVEFALEGRYLPPGAWLGGLIDAAALHRVAEDSLTTYFRDLVDRLYREARYSSETTGVPYT
jgi:hypothetical protein